MTFTSLLSLEQIIAMKEPFAAVEITDADFNRIENIGPAALARYCRRLCGGIRPRTAVFARRSPERTITLRQESSAADL
jgi:hypothetical protein